MRTQAIYSLNKIFQYAISLLLLTFPTVSLSQVIIQGTVKASSDQRAVPNALVKLVNLDIMGADTARVLVSSTFTNQNGEFLFQVSTNVQKNELNVPHAFYLSSTYPNPFSDATQIDFSVQQQDHYSISIYNVLAQIVASFQNTLSPGCYSIHWQGGELPGIYFGLISSGNKRQSFKLVQLTRKAKPSKISLTNAALSPLRKQLQPSNVITTGILQIYVSKTDFQIYKTLAMEYLSKTLDINLQKGENATGILEDIDGNVYKTIKIGNQWWMAENLKVTRYSNGYPIQPVTDNSIWAGLTTGAYCNYNNDKANVAIYGRLYNWYAVSDNRNIAPAGWHVPSDTEWQILVNYLGGDQTAGGKLKETGFAHWAAPNTEATNEYGFSGLPGGYRTSFNGHYYDMASHGYFWTSTDNYFNYAWARDLHSISAGIGHYSCVSQFGLSVRCVRD